MNGGLLYLLHEKFSNVSISIMQRMSRDINSIFSIHWVILGILCAAKTLLLPELVPGFVPVTFVAIVVGFVSVLIAGKAVGEYDEANRGMLRSYMKSSKPDGELIFFAADPATKGKGVGTLLLNELKRIEKGKTIYLFTDSACTYQFYEHRGFERSREKAIRLKLDKKEVDLVCYLYSKTLGLIVEH